MLYNVLREEKRYYKVWMEWGKPLFGGEGVIKFIIFC